ncbi:MAG: hypothetical protein R3B13_20015 [Polyangiaceae bacterium]
MMRSVIRTWVPVALALAILACAKTPRVGDSCEQDADCIARGSTEMVCHPAGHYCTLVCERADFRRACPDGWQCGSAASQDDTKVCGRP